MIGRVGVLGGTFDPVHQGHLHIVRQAQLQYQLDSVVWMLAIHPLHKKSVTPYHHRLHMLHLALEDASPESNWVIDQSDFVRPSYAYEDVLYLKKKYSNQQLFWILGEDSWCDLDNWENIDLFLEHVSLIIYPRNRCFLNPPQVKGRFFFMDRPKINISSTNIKDQIKRDLYPDDLDYKVLEYIQKNHLY